MGHLIPAGTGFHSHRAVDIELTVEEPEPIVQESDTETPEGEESLVEPASSADVEDAPSGGIDLDSLEGVDGDLAGEVKESA